MTKKQRIIFFSILFVAIAIFVIYQVKFPDQLSTDNAATVSSQQQINTQKAIKDIKNGLYDQAGVDVINDIALYINDPPSQAPTDIEKEIYLYNFASAKEDEFKDPSLALSYLEKIKPVEGVFSQSDIDTFKASLQKSAAEEQAAIDKVNSPEERKKRGVTIGMTKEEVLESSWGKPQRINKTTTALGTQEQWVYGIGNYLYFDENGILTAIQNN